MYFSFYLNYSFIKACLNLQVIKVPLSPGSRSTRGLNISISRLFILPITHHVGQGRLAQNHSFSFWLDLILWAPSQFLFTAFRSANSLRKTLENDKTSKSAVAAVKPFTNWSKNDLSQAQVARTEVTDYAIVVRPETMPMVDKEASKRTNAVRYEDMVKRASYFVINALHEW